MNSPLSIRIVEEEQEQAMSFDSPSSIFVAREQQMNSFHTHLSSWCENMNQSAKTILSEADVVSLSTIQGLFVFIYGHDGMGKSTLLDHYRQAASEQRDVNLSRIISWQEFQGSASSNLPGISFDLYAREFFARVAEKIALALHLEPNTLREYQQAYLALNNFREHLRMVSSELLQEKQYRLHIASSMQTLRSSYPEGVNRSNRDQMSEQIEAFLAKDNPISIFWQQEIEDVLRYSALGDKNRERIWNPGKLLGEALGHDLFLYAATNPLLFFFDSYEVSREADAYLRIVMQTAGERVGWVIASRNNFWSNTKYRRDGENENYQGLCLSGRGLFIDLQSSETGFFSVSAIKLYFRKFCIQYPVLPVVNPKLVEHIASITQGIPLGIRIIADLYQKDPKILQKLSPVKTPIEVIDLLMQHYLANPAQKEKQQLCVLVLLRHVEYAEAFLTSVDLLDQRSNLVDVKTHLSKHVDFVVDRYEINLSLHTVVRHIIRQWLPIHRKGESAIRSLLQQLKTFHSEILQGIEKKITRTTISDLFAHTQWVEACLDLIEILFWIDEESAIESAQNFLIASIVYDPGAAKKLLEIVSFFEPHLSERSFGNWQDVLFALSFAPDNSFSDPQKVRRLTAMIADFKPLQPDVELVLADHQEELIALLFWKAGNSAFFYDKLSAQKLCTRAWNLFHDDQIWQNRFIQLYLHETYNSFDQKQYSECESLLEQARDIQYNNAAVYYTLGNVHYAQANYNRAITYYQYVIVLEPEHAYAYLNLANAHYMRKEYPRALDEYNRVKKLASAHLPPAFYYNRANVYLALEKLKEAIDDYDSEIQLEPELAWAYGNRGHAQAMLGNYEDALIDYKLAANLAPEDCNVVWTATWAGFTAQCLQKEDYDKLLQIEALAPEHYAAYICQALTQGIQQKKWQLALERSEKALECAPEEGETHFWKGIIAVYLGKTSIAKEELEKALRLGLPPLFLTPLYWLQEEKPKFFIKYAKPLLQKYSR